MTIGAALSALIPLFLFGLAIFAVIKIFGLKNVLPLILIVIVTFALARSPIGGPAGHYVASIPGRLGIHIHL
jgi:hypothetical protein